MKTRNYKLGKGIVTFVIVALISFVSASTSVGHENQTSGKNAETAKVTAPLTETKSEAITETLQNWMSTGSYWENAEAANFETENTAEVNTSNLSNEINQWMTNGSYWSEAQGNEVQKDSNTCLKTQIAENSCRKK